MSEGPGTGDPRVTMRLLWRMAGPSRRGPKPTLDLDTIVDSAVAVADASGLSAVSMRSIAERLGKSTMSLYTYLPGKAELLDLMYDHALGELPTDYSEWGNWRAALEASTRDVWALYERHPWMVQVPTARPALGPNTFAAFEAQVAILDGTGLTGTEMARAAGAIQVFIQGAARAVADTRLTARATGRSDDEWWAIVEPLLSELTGDIDWPTRFPTLTRLEAEGTFQQLDRAPDDPTPYLERDALDTFEFGLARMLDGIEALIGGRQRES